MVLWDSGRGCGLLALEDGAGVANPSFVEAVTGGWGRGRGLGGSKKRAAGAVPERDFFVSLGFVIADAAGDEGVGEHGGAPEAADEDRDAEGYDGETGAAGFAGVEDLVDRG